MWKSFILSYILLIGVLDGVRGQTTPANVYVDGVCICVTQGYCNLAGGGGNTDGSGLIDPRIMSSGSPASPITGANNVTMPPVSSGIKPVVVSQTTCAAGLELCCPTYYSCGVSYPPIANAPTPLDGQGQTPYGAFPWQTAILTQENVYLGSGVLIDHLHVLTAAHKLDNLNGAPIKVRLGEWDASAASEPLPSIEINVLGTFIHPSYNNRNLKFDLAILRLSSNVPLGVYPTITNICLPSQPLDSMRCWVSGWGKNDFVATGSYQSIMKAVDVPLVEHGACNDMLKSTRLGKSFKLDSSFRCAGGEVAKDACIGDGGSPLTCSIGGFWYLAGIVAWGIGCGTLNVPGVYVNTFELTSWIQTTIMQTVNNGVKTTVAGATTPTAKGPAVTTTVPTTVTTTTTTVKPPGTTTTKPAGPTTTTFTFSPTPSTPRAGSGLQTTTSTSNQTSAKTAQATRATTKATDTTTTAKNAATTTAKKASTVKAAVKATTTTKKSQG